jgi:hypothetical protein
MAGTAAAGLLLARGAGPTLLPRYTISVLSMLSLMTWTGRPSGGQQEESAHHASRQ